MQENVSLKEKTSFKIGGQARYFFVVKNELELQAALSWARERKIKPVIVGGLTNVLLPDGDLEVVIQIAPNNSIELLGAGKVQVWAGEKMAAMAWETVRANLAGLEDFTSLPGSVGGAIWNNAHYNQSLMGDFLLEVSFYDLETGQIIIKNKAELDFAYDQSWFQKNEQAIIIKALFQLKELKETTAIYQLTEKALETAQKRKRTQPLDQPSAGCFWKNPHNSEKLKQIFPQFAAQNTLSAGFLIDQAGLKGERIGGAQVSEKHAAFIINVGGATAKDVKNLAEKVKKTVQEKFAITLEPEVKIV